MIDPGWYFFAGCALLTFILLKRTYRRMGRRGKNSSTAIERIQRPTNPWDGVQRDAHAHIERQKVEMYDMSRDLNAELSSRIIVLEQLVGESQKKIERLEELLAETQHIENSAAPHSADAS